MPAFKNYEVSMMEFRYLCPGASPFKLPQSSLSLAMGSYFPNSNVAAQKQEGILVVHSSKLPFVQQGLEAWESGLIIIRNILRKADWSLGFAPRLAPQICRWGSTQLLSHTGPFLQVFPLHLPQRPLQDHCFQCPRQYFYLPRVSAYLRRKGLYKEFFLTKSFYIDCGTGGKSPSKTKTATNLRLKL